MNQRLGLKIAISIIVILTALWYAFPLDKRISLGLDLQGGMHLVLRVDTSKLSEDAKTDAVERALEIIRNRIDQFGVKEPSIQLQGEEEIVVQLPGITDRDRAIDLIGKTALLEFKLVSKDAQKLKEALEGNVPAGYELLISQRGKEKEELLVKSEPELIGDAVTTAQVGFDNFGAPDVSVEFNSRGAIRFAELTRDNVGSRLAIILDGSVQSAPVIREPIPSGKAQISGNFTQEEAQDLAIILRVGALPAPMEIEEERTVGPLLGQDSINAGIKATLIGASLVVIFMIIYYMFAGIVANIALLLNLLIIMGGLGMFHATLTLPGIAGLILTLGMAVDANVLIYERIREELAAGRVLRSAIANGYDKAHTAIIDSNITTLIAAFLLFQFGTGPIRGFAVTLTIGLLASMFTALVVTKVIFELLLNIKSFTKLPMLQLFHQTNFDFIGKRKICYALSLIIIVAGLFVFLKRGEAAYGIDFAGGQAQEYRFQSPVSVEEMRNILKEVNMGSSYIQSFKNYPNQIMIRTQVDTAEQIQEKFKQSLPNNKFEVLRIEKVGPAVGQHLRRRAILALAWALVGILIYVAFRFRHFNFAVAGVIALFHDVAVTIGFLALTGRQMDLLMVTALLTIAGYSINDTIVIYDRVRENMRQLRKTTLKDVINLSVNQTLSRTVLTTFTTLLVVVSIYLFGGEILNNFAFCLLVGFISGIYSTIYIASPLVLAWSKHHVRS